MTWFHFIIEYELTPMEQIYDFVIKFIIDNKIDLEYDDRIDALIYIMEHLGYKWEEYKEERKQTQYYLDMKRESIENVKRNKKL